MDLDVCNIIGTNKSDKCIPDLGFHIWLVLTFFWNCLIFILNNGVCFLGCWGSFQVASYLRNKATNRQSTMDISNLTFFIHLMITSGIWCIYFNTSFVGDVGDVTAKVLMWPIHDSVLSSLIFLSMSPICQLILVQNPSLILPVSDDFACLSMSAAVWIPLITTSVVCQIFGVYPPAYFVLRQQPLNLSNPLGIMAFTTMALSILTFVGFRYYINHVDKDGERQSSQLITFKTTYATFLASLFGGGLGLLPYSLVVDELRKFITRFFMFFMFPTIVILSKKAIRDRIFPSYPRLERMYQATTRFFVRYLGMPDPDAVVLFNGPVEENEQSRSLPSRIRNFFGNCCIRRIEPVAPAEALNLNVP